MYIVLSGAKKNLGDFLITDRCKTLLQEHRPDRQLVQLPHWETLDSQLDIVNASKAIIIMGGPGFQPNFYPGVYKLVQNIENIKVPIIPMGLGWKGFPGDYLTLKNYRFTQPSLELLKKISNECQYIGCRDYMTKTVLERTGIPNALMTGCPVWYDIESIGKAMSRPKDIKKVVFTPAQDPIYRGQAVDSMKLLRNLFPHAELYCSFHRGFDANDVFTPKADEINNRLIKQQAENLGYKTVDVSFDVSKIQFYDDCDLHIGYRVHGHIYFLSKRKPSILIHEDGRGRGVSESLNVLGVDGFERTFVSRIADGYNIPILSKIIKKSLGVIKANVNTEEMMKNYINEELDSRFSRFAGVSHVIDAHYEVMKKFINSLP